MALIVRTAFGFLALLPQSSVGVDKFHDGFILERIARSSRPRIGIVTMITPDMAENASSARTLNEQYAERWGYGFHVFGHTIDQDRVPHWSKLHVVQIILPEYDYVFWIDADAAFYDQSRRIQDVLGIHELPGKHIWAQDIWPDFPSVLRQEIIDTGTVLFRNSRWTREFLTELYYFRDCLESLNFTEQYCLSVAHRADLLGCREKIAILPTPTINHHILPPPGKPSGMFILHLAGRTNEMRASHFSQLLLGHQRNFTEPVYKTFWDFYRLWADHTFGGLAVQKICLVGLGKRNLAFWEALLFHFPYIQVCIIIRSGAPGLFTQVKAVVALKDRMPDRVADVLDIKDYIKGKTPDGDNLVEGYFCDLFVLGVDSWRHIPSVAVLDGLARDGMYDQSSLTGNRSGFGFSGIFDVYFAWDYASCNGGAGAEGAASGLTEPMSSPIDRLDGDDEDGFALEHACQFLGDSRRYVEQIAATNLTRMESSEAVPIVWGVLSTGGQKLVTTSEGVAALLRVPRNHFQLEI